jgi:NDP-sugar pyrophosphorylase family protein
MQAVVLAGGLGTRLRPVTLTVPKPMVPVGERPFLEYIVTHLARHGFCDILLLVGYLGHVVEQHFRDGKAFGVSIRYGHEDRPLGTAGALRKALHLLDPQFLLLYGDSLLPIDYQELARRFHDTPAAEAMAVIYDNRYGDTDVRGNIDIDTDGCVLRYEKGSVGPELPYVEAGVLCLRRSLIEPLPPDIPLGLESGIYQELISKRRMWGFLTTQRFYDIGTPDRLEEALNISRCLFPVRHSV